MRKHRLMRINAVQYKLQPDRATEHHLRVDIDESSLGRSRSRTIKQ